MSGSMKSLLPVPHCHCGNVFLPESTSRDEKDESHLVVAVGGERSESPILTEATDSTWNGLYGVVHCLEKHRHASCQHSKSLVLDRPPQLL